MTERLKFEDAGRLPTPGDNVAIAVRRLEAGTEIAHGEDAFALSHTVLEGHRFAVGTVARGTDLLSWGLPFGMALRDIAPREYLCNQRVLTALGLRKVDFLLPGEPNFEDRLVRHEFDPVGFNPGEQVSLYPRAGTFPGFERGPGRGVGTRNHVIVLGTSSLTAGFARLLAGRMKEAARAFPNVDGVVAVTHSEGGSGESPNNREFLLRTLAGFMAHPNVGAVLAVEQGHEAVGNGALREYMTTHQYDWEQATRRFLTLEGNLEPMLAQGQAILSELLPLANGFLRTPQPMRELKLALQCGGSDAFSGVSGNPLAGWIAKEVVRHGGAANLAETDELIGAERYMLENVRDVETARAFLEKIDIFRERAGWHGQSVEGNPSGGNIFRGLYNITLKSIGAARKRDPELRLDGVLDYGQPMTEPGYYFMDSPGNDLESIAGQVATGANMILFITGNGSITNFPFVPTIKIMTTSGRYQMLARDMDIDAGRYQGGTPMAELGREAFDYTVRVASGHPSVGEKAGHHQVSIWRDWRQTKAGRVEAIRARPEPDGVPLPINPGGALPLAFTALETERGPTVNRVGLVVPASLCSGQIARMIADQLNTQSTGDARFAALVHTEGCGFGGGGGDTERLFLRTLSGYLRHPSVGRALVLEHGCEKTVNDYIRNFLENEGVDASSLGWASVQMDGGIEPAVARATEWFTGQQAHLGTGKTLRVDGAHLRVGLIAQGGLSGAVAQACAALAQAVVGAGGTVVIPTHGSLLKSDPFLEALLPSGEFHPTLAYGQAAMRPGLHVMETPTAHPVETLTGLGATGVEVMIVHVVGPPLPAHPVLPLLQASADEETCRGWADDLDARLAGMASDAMASELAGLLCATASREYTPRLLKQGMTDFQVTRGLLGISL